MIPHTSCNTTTQIVAWFGTFATVLNCALFLIRANAVFKESPKIRVILGLLWLSTFTTVTSPFSFTGLHIHLTRYCALQRVKHFLASGTITVAVFDTVVFFSVAYKIVSSSRLDEYDGWKVSLPKGTGRVSRTILHTGQLYYLYVSQFYHQGLRLNLILVP